MTIRKVLYATRIGNEDWQEELLTEKEELFYQAKTWASANGFDRFRVAEIDLDVPPDFRYPKLLNI